MKHHVTATIIHEYWNEYLKKKSKAVGTLVYSHYTKQKVASEKSKRKSTKNIFGISINERNVLEQL